MKLLVGAAIAAMCMLASPRHAAAFDTWWHARATQDAMDANGFSNDARLVTQFENYLTDIFPVVNEVDTSTWGSVSKLGIPTDEAYDWMHFDAVFKTSDVIANWDKLKSNTIGALKYYAGLGTLTGQFRLITLFTIIGASLHVVQDFYSHSNWVNHFRDNGKDVPVWFDVDPATRASIDVYTGAYPDGSSPGNKDHKDLNHDTSARLDNEYAVAVATTASKEWVAMLMKEAPEVPWSALQSYNIQNDPTMKNFLETLDSSFVTSTSIAAAHWDGTQPKKTVWSTNYLWEKAQAMRMVANVLGGYHTYLGAAGNVYQLPSPYWVGHVSYHVVRELANGLLLNHKTYTMQMREGPSH